MRVYGCAPILYTSKVRMSCVILDLPEWNFDGSSTNQAEGSNADVFLKPIRLYRDPFLLGQHKLVLCETYNYKRIPTETNHRASCVKVSKKFLYLHGIRTQFLNVYTRMNSHYGSLCRECLAVSFPCYSLYSLV